MHKELLVNNTSQKATMFVVTIVGQFLSIELFVYRGKRGWLIKFVNLCYESHLYKVSMEIFSIYNIVSKLKLRFQKIGFVIFLGLKSYLNCKL